MFRIPVVAAVCATLLILPACGLLSALGQAAQDSGALEERSDELQGRLDDLQGLLDAYGPLAEELGPDIKEGYEKLQEEYGKVRGYINEGVELLGEAQSLHQESLAKATGADGETDWMQYAMLMLVGGGGLYSERRKTAKERNQLHARVDDKSNKVKALEAAVLSMQHKMEVEAARREQPPA